MGRILVLLCCLLDLSSPYTHWYLDPKDQLIKPTHESAFALKPHHQGSIVAFQGQEDDFAEIKKLQGSLIETKHILDEAEEEVDLEPNHYSSDNDCVKAGKKLPEFDLYQTTVIPPTHRGVNTKEYFTKCTECPECRSKEDREKFNAETARTLMPYCSVIVDLPFVMNTFDHLDGVQNAKELIELKESAITPVLYFMGNAEEDFPERDVDSEDAYKDGYDIDHMGHCITIALSRSSDDYVLYNLASIFWRIKGNPYEAIECSRRAYFFAPEKERDMALVNMANVLHKHGFTQNATILLETAIDIYPASSLNHFSLGNMYAVMEDYVEAVEHYSNALSKQSNFDQAASRRNAVLCQAKLHHKLEQQHESLKRTLDELRKFKEKQDEYRLRLDKVDDRRANQSTQTDHNREFEKKLNRPPYIPTGKSLHGQLSLDSENGYRGHNSSRKGYRHGRDRKDRARTESNVYYEMSEDGSSKQIIHTPLRQQYDWNHPNWPSIETCDHHVIRTPEWSEYPSSYVDPSSRGVDVVKFISDEVGVPQDTIVDQPWRKPLCTEWEDDPGDVPDLDSIPGVAHRKTIPMNKQDEYMLRIFLHHINNGRVWPDAIGERIYLAVEQSQVDHPERLWALYNLAALYWRVIGENVHSLDCLKRAYSNAPLENRDIVLVQIANIMYRLGRISDSVMLLRKALEINNKEPISYYAMGTNLVAMNNITGAVEFFSYALYLNPDYIEAFQCLFINKCVLLRQKNNLKPPSDTKSNGDNHMFWEKAWKPSLWERETTDEEQFHPTPQERLGFKLAQEKIMKDETEEQRELRYKKRHEKFGALAAQLSAESEFDIPVDHIELLLEVIEDELNSKRPSIDRISHYVDVPLKADSQIADDKVKYQIAKTLLDKLTKVKEFAEGNAKTIFDHLDKAR